MTEVQYRRLTGEDVEIYLRLRKEAVAAFPRAFTDAPEDVEATPMETHRQRLDTDYMLGAFVEGQLAGNLGYYICQPRKYSHRGYVHGMYVSPAHQGRGIGYGLLTRLIDHARNHVEHLELSVNTESEATIRLYEKAGFRACGLLPKIMKLGDEDYVDDIYMWMEVG